MKPSVKAILAVILYVVCTNALGTVGAIIECASNPDFIEACGKSNIQQIESMMGTMATSTWMHTFTILGGILAVLILWRIKGIDMKRTATPTKTGGKMTAIIALAALTGIVACDLLEEQLDLPNILEDTFTGMSSVSIGMAFIAIVGPVFEEFIFREGVEGNMLRGGCKPWTAIIVSAVVFGIIHMNPAQIPFAFLVGLLLGVIYYKTGNIVLTTIIHIINNSVAVTLMAIYGDEADDIRMADFIGGDIVAWVAIAVLATASVLLLRVFWKGLPDQQYEDITDISNSETIAE